MDALVASFVAAFLAEWGDKTQLLAALLAARTGRPGPVFAATVAAIAAANIFAAFAGAAMVGLIPLRAAGLLLAIALIVGGLAGLIRRRTPDAGSLRLPLVIATMIMALAAQVTDRTPFLTFALAARFDAPMFAAAGATVGATAACLPAILLADRFGNTIPLRPIRLVVAVLFLLSGFAVTVSTLQLV
ncbi:MAG: TMEM165/GDT1 family protein [Sphingomonas sp.]